MIRLLPAILGLTFLASPSPAMAQAYGESIPSAVRGGLKVSIVDDEGRQIDGRVMDVSAEGIRLSLKGTSEEIRLDRIVRIDKPDGLKNGALVGLGVGLSFTTLGLVIAPEGMRGPWVFATLLSNGVGFTLLGTAIDAIVDNRRTLYERGRRTQARVAPIVEPRGSRRGDLYRLVRPVV